MGVRSSALSVSFLGRFFCPNRGAALFDWTSSSLLGRSPWFSSSNLSPEFDLLLRSSRRRQFVRLRRHLSTSICVSSSAEALLVLLLLLLSLMSLMSLLSLLLLLLKSLMADTLLNETIRVRLYFDQMRSCQTIVFPLKTCWTPSNYFLRFRVGLIGYVVEQLLLCFSNHCIIVHRYMHAKARANMNTHILTYLLQPHKLLHGHHAPTPHTIR